MTAPDKLEDNLYLRNEIALINEAAEYLENAAIVAANRSGPSHDPENKRQWALAQAVRRIASLLPTPSPEAGEVMRLHNQAVSMRAIYDGCTDRDKQDALRAAWREAENAFRAYVTTMIAAKGERG